MAEEEGPEFITGIPPGHIPVVLLKPEQYMALNAAAHRFPIGLYWAMSALAHNVADIARLGAQAFLVDRMRREWIPGAANFPMALSCESKDISLSDLSNRVLETVNRDYQYLMSAWITGIETGMGAAFSSAQEQFMSSGQLLYAYSDLQYQTSVIPRMRRFWLSQYTPNVPDGSLAWILWRRGRISEKDFNTYASYDGWDTKGIGYLKEAWSQIPNERAAFRMFMRGSIKYEDYKKFVVANGWEEEWHSRLYEFYEWRPNSREAFRLFRRGIIDDKYMYGLFRSQGYDPRWDKVLPELYERMPLPRDAFNMLMRGVIDTKGWRNYISMNEWEEGAADYLYQIYQRLPSSHEAFYMHQKGLITVSQRDTLYRMNGYDSKYHSLLTENYYYVPTLYDLTRIADYVEIDLIWATKVLKERGLRDRDIAKIIAMLKIRPLRSEITRQITIWLNRRMKGWVSETDFEAAIQTYVDAGLVQSTEKTLLLEEGQLKYEDELMDEKITALEWWYRTAVISDEELLAELLALGVVEEKANLMVEVLKAQGYYGYY